MTDVRYRVYEHGKLLGIYSPKDASRLTGCPVNSIRVRAWSGERYGKRYTFERVRDESVIDSDSFDVDFCRMWNEIRLEIMRKLGKGAYICDHCGRIIQGEHITVPEYGTALCRHMHYACFKDECYKITR